MKSEKVKEREKLEKEYREKVHDIADRVAKTTTPEECYALRREFVALERTVKAKDIELFRSLSVFNSRVFKSIESRALLLSEDKSITIATLDEVFKEAKHEK